MCKSKFRCQEVVAHSIVSSMCWCCGMGEVDKCAVPIPKCKVEKLEKIEWTFILFQKVVFKVSTAISLLIPIKTSSHETIVLEPKKTSTWFFGHKCSQRTQKAEFFLEKSCDFGRQSRLTNLWVLWVMSSRHAFGDLGQPQHDQWGYRTSMPDPGTEKRAYAIQEFSPHALPPGACERAVFGESFILRNEYSLIARFVFDYFVACFRFRGVILRWR